MAAIYSLVASSGPGQLKEVTADIKALVDDAADYDKKVGAELAKYHRAQYTIVKVNGTDVVLSEHNHIDGDKYHDGRGHSFTVDPATTKVSGIEAHDGETEDELRSALDRYRAEHYPSPSALGVYPTDGGVKIVLVGNRYNQSNYWTGRWRNTYSYSKATKKATGVIEVDVHYFEDGNVRLLTKKEVAIDDASPTNLATKIEAAEKAYQDELNKAFGQLGEGAFRQLRRQLPVTRSKINWQSIGAMRLGQDVQGGRERK